MPYGEIVNTSLRLLWKEKNLWFFSLVGLALSALGSAIYTMFYAGAQATFMDNLNEWIMAPSGPPDAFFVQMMSFYGVMLVGGLVVACASLLGYAVNLIMRGAVISEAGKALADEPTDFRRGAREGAGKAVSIFLVDLLWALPGFVFGLCAVIAFVVGFGNLFGAAVAADSGVEDLSAIWTALGGMMFTMLALACIGIAYFFIYGVFAPLMYQALVLGKKTVGDAVREGWSLAKANLGSMVVFLLILIAARIGLGILMQVVMAPFVGVWMVSWFQSMADLSQGLPPSISPTAAAMMGLMGLVSAFLTLLVNSGMQSFSLTMYANVYQRLASNEAVDVEAKG